MCVVQILACVTFLKQMSVSSFRTLQILIAFNRNRYMCVCRGEAGCDQRAKVESNFGWEIRKYLLVTMQQKQKKRDFSK